MKRAGNYQARRFLWLLMLMTATAQAGPFVAPAEGPVAFRRDRLPIDPEMMSDLSQQLLILARAQEMETAAQRRSVAQMLALATALDPGNAKARDVIDQLVGDRHRGKAERNPEQLEKVRSRVWQLLTWLESPEAGPQAQPLARCLLDVMASADPEHAQAKAARAAGERGAWDRWIPAISAYEPPPKIKEVAATKLPSADPEKPVVLLESAQVSTPLWKQRQKSETAAWELVFSPVTMTARPAKPEDGKPKPFSLSIGSQGDRNPLAALVPGLLTVLEKQHGPLPTGLRVSIDSEALTSSSLAKKRQSVSAAAAVLASAAITGREPDATIIGLLDESGAYQLPTGFWNQLQALGPGNGGRLVLPAAAAEYLPSLLAMEMPQVFFDYEVVLAGDFRELLDLSAKSPDGVMAKVSTQFREIREKIGTQPLGQYLANPFIRRRLAEIFQEAPYHQSAKMLAIQGAGNRPVYIPRKVLATELRRMIEPTEWLTKKTNPSFDPEELEKLGAIYPAADARLEHLLRYTEKADRELVGRVKDMATTIRVLDRAARGRGDSLDVLQAVLVAHQEFVQAYTGVIEQLARESGEPEIPATP